MMIAASNVMSAQTEHGFVPFAVEQEFSGNGFSWFRHALLLAAGDEQQSNAMTIGWGGIGTLWGKTAVTVYVAEQQSNAMTIGWGGIGTLWGKTAVTVYVAEQRYTKEFMERAEYFTVMAFPEDRNDVLEYMGTKSGRDGDKAAALGLHTAYTENGTPYYTEASMVVECRIMYAAPFNPQYFKGDPPRRMYANFPAGLHTEYIGEVVNAWKREP